MDELDAYLEREEWRDRQMIALVAVLCLIGTIGGLAKVAAVHFTFHPHHWPF